MSNGLGVCVLLGVCVFRASVDREGLGFSVSVLTRFKVRPRSSV